MPKSKARTNDWVKLANGAIVARDHLRGCYQSIKSLTSELCDENKRTPGSRSVWVKKQDLAAVISAYSEAGNILTAALKEREHGNRKTKQ